MKPANALVRDPSGLTLDIYPDGESAFRLYEDDGVTRSALERNEFAWTEIKCNAAPQALRKGGHVVVSVGASAGRFQGQYSTRAYQLKVHLPKPTYSVLLRREGQNTTLKQMSSLAQLDYATAGWFFSKALLGGIVHVKTPVLTTAEPFAVDLSTQSQYPHIFMQPCNGGKDQSFIYDPASGFVKLSSDQASCLTVGDDKDVASGTPAVEMQPCENQKWILDDDSGNMHPSTDHSKCIDIDAADHGAEIYPCGHLQANQRFNFTDDGSGVGHHSGTFRRISDGACMTVAHSQWRPSTASTLEENAAVII